MLRTRKFVAVALMAAMLSLGAACDKKKAVDYTRTAVQALKDTRSILTANNIPTSKLDLAITAGEAAQRAFESGAANSIDLASAFITAFEGVVADVEVIKDEQLRKYLTIGLLVGNIALHALADLLAKEEGSNPLAARTVRASSNVAAIAAFKRQRVWKCRNAITGRYAKAEFCKAHPDTSVVER